MLPPPASTGREMEISPETVLHAYQALWARNLVEKEYGYYRVPDAPRADTRLLKVPEVAAILRVSNMTVYRLCQEGELKYKMVGRYYRIFEEGVRAYLGDRGPA
jgi:excisionase family DNA binding protein